MSFQLVDIGNPAQVVTGGQVLVAIAGLVLFPGDEFSSFLDVEVASQLNSDDLRNVGQALVKHNFLNILLAHQSSAGTSSCAPELKQ